MNVSSLPSGPGYLFWAVVGSAVVAGFIALLTVAKHRLIAKKRGAYDFIVNMWMQNREYDAVFFEMADKDELIKILDAKTKEELGTKAKIRTYLNTFELLAVSIKWNVIDENVCKAIIGDALVKRWQKAFPLINEIRTREGDEEFFEHFQNLAKKWKDHPMIKQDWWIVALLKEITRI